MKINNTTLAQFREDFKKAVKELEEKYEVQISAGRITYDDNSFSLKIEVVNGTDKVEANRVTFEKNLKGTYLEKEDFLRSFVQEGRTYVITGINPKGRTRSIIIKDAITGKEYCCGPEYIPFAKKRKEDLYKKIYEEISTDSDAKHTCKYCKAETEGTNEDLLCPDCQQTFGHRYYSEL